MRWSWMLNLTNKIGDGDERQDSRRFDPRWIVGATHCKACRRGKSVSVDRSSRAACDPQAPDPRSSSRQYAARTGPTQVSFHGSTFLAPRPCSWRSARPGRLRSFVQRRGTSSARCRCLEAWSGDASTPRYRLPRGLPRSCGCAPPHRAHGGGKVHRARLSSDRAWSTLKPGAFLAANTTRSSLAACFYSAQSSRLVGN